MSKERIPLKEGIWTQPLRMKNKPRLIGSICCSCGEIYFPKREKSLCINCQGRDLKEIKLSRRGKIYSFTIVTQRPPVYYKGPVPYAVAWVELPEGVRLESLLTNSSFESLKVGMDVKLVIEKLYKDQKGNEILTYKFRPVDNQTGRGR